MKYGQPHTQYLAALHDLGAPKDAAEAIAKAYPAGHGLASATPRLIASAVGIDVDQEPPAWVGRIGAAFRLSYATDGRRAHRASDCGMTTPSEVVRRIRFAIAGEPSECFVVMLLDAKQREIDTLVVHRGSLTTVEVHPREIFRPALQCGAHSVILAHNHPSGDPAPSDADVALTNRLVESGMVMGVQVLDHIVIGATSHASLVALGLVH